MVILVENDVEKRIALHTLFGAYVPADQLLTVNNFPELLLAVTRVKAQSIWISSADQHLLTELREPGLCDGAQIYVLAASSMDINPLLLKRCQAEAVFTPLRPYQIEQLVTTKNERHAEVLSKINTTAS